MIIIVAKYLIPKGFVGLTIWPVILLARDEDRQHVATICHERIHIRQQVEMLVLLFFIWYGLEYLLRLLQYRNAHLAYRNISFEREAYANEKNPEYLNSRVFWSFLKYL